MASREAWRQWVRVQASYAPELESEKAIGDALKEFETSLLSEDTSIWLIQGTVRSVFEARLDLDQLAQIMDDGQSGLFRSFFIDRLPAPGLLTGDYHLRISAEALRLLASRHYMTPSFLFALSKYWLPNGHVFHQYVTDQGRISWRQWYFLPVRVQVPCSDLLGNHATSPTGQNQMNPLHYLHLPDEHIDIRGTQIAVYLFHDGRNATTTMISFNFMHGRYSKIIEEPQQRIDEAMKHPEVPSDPMFVHLVFLTTVLRLWNNTLYVFNEQLIAYERGLQDDVAGQVDTNALYARLSKALHAMAAQVQRYEAELASLERTIRDISVAFSVIFGHDAPSLASIDNVKSQLVSTSALVQELEKKTQNILALLFHRMQITNDRLMVSNGEAMHAIMRATQDEALISRDIAARSQQLAEEMKKDSVSMKTIAILTMFFLPATSFAALLAMPFFSTNPYLANVHQFWIWIVLTIPTTAVAFAFYHFWRKHDEARTAIVQPDV